MLREFKQFIMRGNVVDLAVAVVTAFVADIITPLIAAIFGKPDFSNLNFTINKSTFLYGDFLNAVIAFLSIATAIFFFVVKPLNALMARGRKPEEEVVSDEERRHQELLAAIRESGR